MLTAKEQRELKALEAEARQIAAQGQAQWRREDEEWRKDSERRNWESMKAWAAAGIISPQLLRELELKRKAATPETKEAVAPVKRLKKKW